MFLFVRLDNVHFVLFSDGSILIFLLAFVIFSDHKISGDIHKKYYLNKLVLQLLHIMTRLMTYSVKWQ